MDFHNLKENFEKFECEYLSLCNYQILLEEAIKSNYITKKHLPILEKWSENPSKWGDNV